MRGKRPGVRIAARPIASALRLLEKQNGDAAGALQLRSATDGAVVRANHRHPQSSSDRRPIRESAALGASAEPSAADHRPVGVDALIRSREYAHVQGARLLGLAARKRDRIVA